MERNVGIYVMSTSEKEETESVVLNFPCNECSEVFASMDAYTEHNNAHKEALQQQHCIVCNKLFKKKSFFKQHMKDHVRGNKYTCERCSKVFLRKTVLMKHTLKHHADFPCGMCNKIRCCKKVKNHRCKPNMYGVQFVIRLSPDKTYSNADWLTIHKHVAHKTELLCKLCKIEGRCRRCTRRFRTDKSCKAKRFCITSNKSEELVEGNKMEADDQVKLETPYQSCYEIKVEAEKEPVIDDDDEDNSDSGNESLANYLGTLEEFSESCMSCVYRRFTRGKYPFADSMSCMYCGCVLDTQFDMGLHIVDHYMRGELWCKTCSKRLPHSNAFIEHTRRFLQCYKCVTCPKVFAHRSLLLVHEREHMRVTPFQCSFCARRFHRKFDMKMHVRQHTGDLPFECAVCSVRFATQLLLDNHERQHVNQLRGKALWSPASKYCCAHCPKRFADKVTLRKHLRTVHNDNRFGPERNVPTANNGRPGAVRNVPFDYEDGEPEPAINGPIAHNDAMPRLDMHRWVTRNLVQIGENVGWAREQIHE